jgi:hypothetical protein
MAVSLNTSGSEDVRVIAGENLILRLRAYDPTGIGRIFVQCFQFSTASTNKLKLAFGEILMPLEESLMYDTFEICVEFPENVALGKWGIQLIEFTNGRGYKSSFYRGQGKFDNIIFEVVAPPSKEEELLQFTDIEIASDEKAPTTLGGDKRGAFHKSL